MPPYLTIAGLDYVLRVVESRLWCRRCRERIAIGTRAYLSIAGAVCLGCVEVSTPHVTEGQP